MWGKLHVGNEARGIPTMDGGEVSCFVEFSSASSALNFVVTINRHGDFKKLEVEIEDNSVTISKDQKEFRYQLDELELLPFTCRGLKYHQIGELHFNIQGKQLIADKDSKTRIYRDKKLSSQNQVVEDMKLYQNKWFCAVCQQRILKESSFFSRVLPLPSENWSDFADIWFCHKHEDSGSTHGVSDAQQNGRLLPRRHDCLVGDTYFLISSCQTDRRAIRVDKTGMIMCSRCGHQIGVTIGNKDDDAASGHEVYKLYLYSLLLIKDMQNYNFKHLRDSSRSRSESFFSTLLQEQSQIYTSFRFIIESPVTSVVNQTVTNTTSYCLVWLMDSSCTVYTSRSIDQTGSQINNDSDTEGGGNGAWSCKLMKENIMKLLFRCQLSAAGNSGPTDFTTKTVISLWKKDNTVHGISLPHPVFLQLIDQLIHNSKCLPQSQRFLNGFHVSFLKHSESGFGT